VHNESWSRRSLAPVRYAVTNMAITFNEIEALLRFEYDRIWKDWYSGNNNVNPARIEITIGDHTTFYRPSEDAIYIFVPEGNFRDYEHHLRNEPYRISKLGWYLHQTELVHEMLHEYQSKLVSTPSEKGLALFEKFKGRFSGNGHDALFFTAISEKADYFNVTAEELIADL
jgi:hypothetical protein